MCCAESLNFDYNFRQLSSVAVNGIRDILVVVDDSCSMKEEQEKLGNSFSHFINLLANRSIDWQIAITTTSANGFRPFPNGDNILNPQTPDYVGAFNQTVQITETAGCEEGQSDSVNNDERPIRAINKVLDMVSQNSSNFPRPNTHFAVIIITDEDHISGNYRRLQVNINRLCGTGQYGPDCNELKLLDNDLVENLIPRVAEVIGEQAVLSFHSIIIQSDDVDCLGKQLKQLNPGSDGDQDSSYVVSDSDKDLYYGKYYEKISNPNEDLLSQGTLIRGTVGSICEPDYSDIIELIGTSLQTRVLDVGCEGRDIKTLDVYNTSEDPPSFLTEGYDYEVLDNKVHIKPHLPVDMGIEVKATCYHR